MHVSVSVPRGPHSKPSCKKVLLVFQKSQNKCNSMCLWICTRLRLKQNHKLVQYMGTYNARVWYPVSDLLHLRNDVLIGCLQKCSRAEDRQQHSSLWKLKWDTSRCHLTFYHTATLYTVEGFSSDTSMLWNTRETR